MKSSNEDRTKWRAKCRKKLAHHIGQRLGIQVDPAHVRLIPTAGDPYRWENDPSKSYLFAKQLSKLSIGPLTELYREVGSSFHAVAASRSRDGPQQTTGTLVDEVHKLRQERKQLQEYIRQSEKRRHHERSKAKREKQRQRDLVVRHGEIMQKASHEIRSLLRAWSSS